MSWSSKETTIINLIKEEYEEIKQEAIKGIESKICEDILSQQKRPTTWKDIIYTHPIMSSVSIVSIVAAVTRCIVECVMNILIAINIYK